MYLVCMDRWIWMYLSDSKWGFLFLLVLIWSLFCWTGNVSLGLTGTIQHLRPSAVHWGSKGRELKLWSSGDQYHVTPCKLPGIKTWHVLVVLNISLKSIQIPFKIAQNHPNPTSTVYSFDFIRGFTFFCLQRSQVYFRIMPVLRTSHLEGQEEDLVLLRKLRDLTKQRLQARAPDDKKCLGVNWVTGVIHKSQRFYFVNSTLEHAGARKALIGSWHTESRIRSALSSAPTVAWRRWSDAVWSDVYVYNMYVFIVILSCL